jgi:hypothetical protein
VSRIECDLWDVIEDFPAPKLAWQVRASAVGQVTKSRHLQQPRKKEAKKKKKIGEGPAAPC